jgi:hypothetical protein
LVRRLSLDLTGLPPTIDTIERFLADRSPNAYERLVDELLASEDYGEHLAREWLDGARYADTNGFQNDFQRHMWPWRDWVIDAFNANMPFDQFTVEQLAGDLLPDATDAQRVATGFHRNHRANTEGGSIEEEWRVENIVDRVETTGTMFLGLSIGCARCHDHKYDPVTSEEFYEFFAFFNSTADKGFYEETRGNAGPQVALPSYENQIKIAGYDLEIAEAEAAYEHVKAAAPFEYAAWRAELNGSNPIPPAAAPVFAAPPEGADSTDAVPILTIRWQGRFISSTALRNRQSISATRLYSIASNRFRCRFGSNPTVPARYSAKWPATTRTAVSISWCAKRAISRFTSSTPGPTI